MSRCSDDAVNALEENDMLEIMADFGLPVMVLPDYSDSFDGVVWGQYEKNIEHGTAIGDIEKAAGARADAVASPHPAQGAPWPPTDRSASPRRMLRTTA